ncbi:MAG: hypothetical protein Q8W46_11670 [Candidatus Palauibacterales bacterium]|nr:hypothetical protein [Candidatus Palauibacterales bacterium]
MFRSGWLVASIVAIGAVLCAPRPAVAQFGRNKVQYESRVFQIIRTDHFDVYFYEEEREAAVDAARMAERIYGRLSRILDHDFRDRKPIILYASQTDFQQTNVLGGHISESTGGVTESLKDRVLLPLTGSYEELQHVLAHELVHSFQFDILKRSALESSASPFAFVPSLWFMEGMAEYLSVGRIDAKTVAWMRDAALDGYLRTINEMDRFNDYLSYRFGQSLWAYIGRKWGDETIGILLKRAPALGAERAFERTLGITLGELSEEWHEAVRAAYVPRIRQAGEVSRIARRITWHAFPRGREKAPSFIAPALSPDGTEVVYLSDMAYDLYTFFDLYVADAQDGKPKRRLVKSARGGDFESLRYLTSSAEFAPDGRRVAFVAQSGGRDAIHIIDVRSGQLLAKWEPPLNGIQNPTWSPDGRKIAFTGLVGGISDLYVWDTRSNEMQRLTSGKYARLHPAWSPDGRTLALATDESPDTDLARLVFDELRLALYHFETGDVELLPGGDLGTNINPVWSPEGESLAFLSDRSGVFNVYLYDLQERNVRRLTDVLTGIMGEGALLTSPGLTWARKADRLAFSYFEEAGFNLYTVDHPRDLVAPESYGPTVTAADEVGRPRVVETVRGRADIAREETDEPSSFYLTEEGFRRSDFGEDALAAGAATGAPGAAISVAALNDSASLALPDTSTLAFRDYTVSLSPDYVGTPTFGATTGGFYGNGIYGSSFVALSDMLGNHNMIIAGAIQGSFDNAQFLTSYAYLKNRLNFGVSFAQYPFFRFLGTRFGEVPDQSGDLGEFNVFERDQFRSVEAIAQYPLSSFARFEFSLSMASIQQDLIFQGLNRTTFENFSITLDGSTRIFFQPEVAYVFDNSLPGFTGPLAGRRMRISGAAFLGDLNMADILVDYRHYHRLPLGATFAQRALSFTRFNVAGSRDVEDFELAWGGPYYLRGYDPGSYGPAECVASEPQSDFDLFCPAQRQVIGSSTLLLNSEVRIPILNPVKDDWLPLNFPPIDLALFFDAGVAFTPGLTTLVWEREPGQDIVAYREPLTSYGASLRMNLFFAVLRIDYTVPRDRGRAFDNGMWTVAFGEMF